MGPIPSGAVAHVGEPENRMVASVAEGVKGGLKAIWDQRISAQWAFMTLK